MPTPAYFPKQYRWTHTDELRSRVVHVIEKRILVGGDWDLSLDSVADWRALVYFTYLLRANLSSDPDDVQSLTTGEGSSQTIQEINGEPIRFSNSEREHLSDVLGNVFTPFVIRDSGIQPGQELTAPTTLITHAGNPITTGAGWIWVPIALAAVVVTGVVALYAVQRGSDIIDRQIRRNEESKRYFHDVGLLEKALNEHLESERQAGHELPLPDIVKQYVDIVKNHQTALTSKKEEPLPHPILDEKTLPSVSMSLGLGVALAAVVAGIFLLKGKSHV